MPRHRVLYIHHGSGTGGAPLSLAFLIAELDSEHFEPIVACDFGQDKNEEFFRQRGLEPIHCDPYRFSHTYLGWFPLTSPRGILRTARWLFVQYPRGKANIGRLVRDTQPDLVHLNSLTLAPYAPLIKRQGIPVVMHVREPVVRGLLGVRRAWLRRLTRDYVDAIVYICEDNRERLNGEDGKSKVIYNFVDFARFNGEIDCATARADLALPAERPMVLFPGGSQNLVKGVIPLMHALAQLRRSVPDVLCVMPGSLGRDRVDRTGWRRLLVERGPEQRVELLIRELGLADNVLRLPFSFSMETYFAACDVAVIPFIVPHFARPVIEAGSMRRPVVASRIGGVTEVVQDGETGLLVPPNDPLALADALARVLTNHDLAVRLGAGGYVQARAKFDAKCNALETAAMYEPLLHQDLAVTAV